MIKKEKELISDDTTKDRRATLLNEIKESQKEIGELQSEIIEYEKRKAVKDAELYNSRILVASATRHYYEANVMAS